MAKPWNTAIVKDNWAKTFLFEDDNTKIFEKLQQTMKKP